MQIRDFKGASELFLDSVATFNKDSFITFNDIVFYTVLTGMISLDRSTIKNDIMKSADILTVIRDIPNLKPFLESFFKCNYKQFMVLFVKIIDQISEDKYLGIHRKFFIRRMRQVAYNQFLEAYKPSKWRLWQRPLGYLLSSSTSNFHISKDHIHKS